jgi:hypothetical protein
MGQSQKRGDSVPEEYTARYVFAMLRALKREEGLKPERVGNKVRVENVEIPHGTFYRYIGKLESDKIIYEEGGRYYFFWKKEKEEFQQYKTSEEYRVKLEHSEKLLRSVLSDIMNVYVNELIFQHFKTGYPELYEKYHKLQELGKKWEQEKKLLQDSIKKFFIEHGFQCVDSLVLDLYEDVTSLLRDLEVVVEGKIRLKDNAHDLSLEAMFKRMMFKEHYTEHWWATILEAINDKSIRLAYEKAMNAEKKYNESIHEVDFAYRKDIEQLALRVQHGEPLRGSCDLCPKVTIERTNP